MADKEENEEPATRGNEWEVVSLTASTFAAAPTPEQGDMTEDESVNSVGEDQAEISRALFMSGHFVFPPSLHENLPLESENNEIRSGQETEDAGSQLLGEEGIRSETKESEIINTKGFTIPDEFPGIQIFDEKGNLKSVGGSDFEEGTEFQGLNLVDKEQCLYSKGRFSEPTIVGPNEVDESAKITEAILPYNEGLDSDLSPLPKPTDKDYDASNVPSGAWWKRRAASFYAHAKEGNSFWSIFIAAAVMGLVIIGQQWQQEKWQVLQLKGQFSINGERMGRVLGPLTRLKDVIVGGQRQGSLIRGSISRDH